MGDLRDIMEICCKLESGSLKGIPGNERQTAAKDYMMNYKGDTIDLDSQDAENLPLDVQIVICDACYTSILKRFRKFERFIKGIYRDPLARFICDHDRSYLREFGYRIDILEGLIKSSGNVSSQEALALAEYTEKLDDITRGLNIKWIACLVIWVNIAIIAICAIHIWL